MASKTIASIIRGTDILKSVSNGVARVSDISDRLQLSKSTVHRFLKSLEILDPEQYHERFQSVVTL